MTVSYSTTDFNCDSSVSFGTSETELSHTAANKDGCESYTHTSKYGEYNSDCLHHVSLPSLQPSTKYYYKAGGDEKDSTVYSFTTAPVKGTGYPLNIAVLGDLGQTDDSMITVNHINDQSDEIDFILHAGDMSYADSDQSRWESWFDKVEFLSTKLPWYVSTGNHEIEHDTATGNTFVPYETRFKMPWVKEAVKAPSPEEKDCCPSAFLGTYEFGNSYYSFVYGPSTIIVLNSYSDTSVGSTQYNWLVDTLEAVDRELTPWVLVAYHSPIYNSNRDHQNEKQTILMKDNMEALYSKYRVNAIFSGHVHAYERTYKVVSDQRDDSGPMYILIGDGGNREGHAGGYIDAEPPVWSAFRDNTIFGHGMITLVNATHAIFSWEKNTAEGLWELADSEVLVNQYYDSPIEITGEKITVM